MFMSLKSIVGVMLATAIAYASVFVLLLIMNFISFQNNLINTHFSYKYSSQNKLKHKMTQSKLIYQLSFIFSISGKSRLR